MSKTISFFKFSVTVNKPKEVLFNALTEAGEMVHWFPSRAESDPKPGGDLKLFFDFVDAGQNGKQEEKYVEVVANDKFSYTWKVREGSIPTMVTFHLKEMNGETTVDLEHSTSHEGADEKKLFDGHSNQWTFFLMNLKGYLEAGMDLRKEKLNQVTQ